MWGRMRGASCLTIHREIKRGFLAPRRSIIPIENLLILCQRKDHRKNEQNGKHYNKDLQYSSSFFFLILAWLRLLNVLGFLVCHNSLTHFTQLRSKAVCDRGA